MPNERIMDSFQVTDENGNHLRVEEVCVEDGPETGTPGRRHVVYRTTEGAPLTAYLDSREFRNEESGEMYYRL